MSADDAPRPWWDGLAPARAQVPCRDTLHHISWRRGKLLLEDHDVLAERSLIALGGEPPLCIDVLDAWRRARHPHLMSLLLLLERGPRPWPWPEGGHRLRHQEPIVFPPNLSPQTLRRIRHHFKVASEREDPLWEVHLIEAMPPGLRRMFALSLIVGLERVWCRAEPARRAHVADAESAMATIAKPLLEKSIRRWRRSIRPYATFVVDARLPAAGEEVSCSAMVDAGGATILLTLRLSWFFEVWAHGLALVDGCFVMCRHGGPPPAAATAPIAVTAVRWERAGPHLATAVPAPALLMHGDDGAWCLRWT